ncbi:MAG TPA: hypothetical protein VLC46_02105 [Thermoanaerobaculia bacterium]|jgi:hypothetical protein|nr:hypothetical protein [Thermoanaerobaculia bacterium]
MLGKRASDEEQRAYRSFVSLGRIADDVQAISILGALALLAIVVPTRSMAWLFPLAFLIPWILSQFVLPSVILWIAPPHVVKSLPRGRIDGPATPHAPHTYADLIHYWLRPDWTCSHPPYSATPSPAPSGVILGYVAELFSLCFGVAGLDYFIVNSHPHSVRLLVTPGVAVIGIQVYLASRFTTRNRLQAYTSPSPGEARITLFVAVLATATITLVALSYMRT